MHFMLLCLLWCSALGYVSAAEQPPALKPMYVNTRVEPTEVALNQPLRLEFTTMPRQIEGIDVATVVTSTLSLAGADDWRLLGRPLVTEQESKSKVIRVVVTLLPRRTGVRAIPDIPITWLQGNYVSHAEPVRVLDRLQVAGTTHDLPKEIVGIADWKWGTELSDAEKRVVPSQIQRANGQVTIQASEGFTLDFLNGRLGQARMHIADLDLESGRIDFLRRWGLPIDETAGQIRWVIGWTLITASTGEGGKGTVLLFQREDALGYAARSVVKSKVLDVLDRQ